MQNSTRIVRYADMIKHKKYKYNDLYKGPEGLF